MNSVKKKPILLAQDIMIKLLLLYIFVSYTQCEKITCFEKYVLNEHTYCQDGITLYKLITVDNRASVVDKTIVCDECNMSIDNVESYFNSFKIIEHNFKYNNKTLSKDNYVLSEKYLSYNNDIINIRDSNVSMCNLLRNIKNKNDLKYLYNTIKYNTLVSGCHKTGINGNIIYRLLENYIFDLNILCNNYCGCTDCICLLNKKELKYKISNNNIIDYVNNTKISIPNCMNFIFSSDDFNNIIRNVHNFNISNGTLYMRTQNYIITKKYIYDVVEMSNIYNFTKNIISDCLLLSKIKGNNHLDEIIYTIYKYGFSNIENHIYNKIIDINYIPGNTSNINSYIVSHNYDVNKLKVNLLRQALINGAIRDNMFYIYIVGLIIVGIITIICITVITSIIIKHLYKFV